MMDFLQTDAYLLRLSGAENYKALLPADREILVFTAYERLSLHYDEALLTPKVVALQTLYMANRASVEGAEAVALRNIQLSGAKSYSVDGVSVSFGDSTADASIAPDVLLYFEKLELRLRSRARVGRLF